jgi:hypothetical protein
MTTEYVIWAQMRERCTKPYNHAFSRYGGRGITICARWAVDFLNFLADMGPRPSTKHTIDRINNDGNYEPGNCRWATYTENNRNKRNNRRVVFCGREYAVSELAESRRIDPKLVISRLGRGWSVEDSVGPLRTNWNRRRVRDGSTSNTLPRPASVAHIE